MDELKSPAEWEIELDARVLDPDGWRGPNHKSFDEPISYAEFIERAHASTVELVWRIKERNPRPLVHNHGVEEGPGLSCPEYRIHGVLTGACRLAAGELDD